MKGRLLRILSAVVVVPIIATSMIFANDVKAAPKTYNGTITPYTRETHNVVNKGKYFEPAADGKYQAMIYFHGASDQVNGTDLANLPERLMNDMNKWINMGYCDPMVVITPSIFNSAAWGIEDFKSFVKDGNLESLIKEIQSGEGLGKKVDTSKPIIVAGYSMGASAALYTGTLFRNGDPNGDGIADVAPIYNVGAFSPSYCYYSEESPSWIKDPSDCIFSTRTDGHFLLTGGAGENSYFNTCYNTDKRVLEKNGTLFKFHKYNSEWGPHGWACVFELGTFEYLYYLKFNELPSEEIMTNAVWGEVTISGTTTVGSTLTASLNTYYDVGASYRGYQWYRENTSTGAFTAISGATSSTYTLTSADAGCKVRCKIWDTREPKTPQGSGKWGYSYRTTATISSGQQQPQAIKGTVTLSADYYRYGYKVRATVSGSNATNLKYQWKRGDSVISGATSYEYVLTESDIGKQISCIVTDKDGKYTGSISSSKTATIGKAFGPNPPSGVSAVNCSSKGAKDGKITGVSDKMEYAVQTNGNPGTFNSISGTTVTGLAAGTYYVRYKATSTADAGGMAEVYIKENSAQAIKGTVTLSADHYRYGYEISATVSGNNATNLSYQWKRGDSNISGATGNKYKLTESDIGKQISCVVTDKDGKYTGSISSSKTATIGKAFGPNPPSGVSAVNCSSKGAKDGKITGVSDKMEYAVQTNGNPGTFKSISGTSVTGLAAGTYYVRYKTTSTADAGGMAEVYIKDGAAQSINGTVTLSADHYRYGYKVSAAVSGSNATNLKYQWKRGDSVISGATSYEYVLTESDIGKQISCVVTDKDGKYTGSISSSKTTTIGKAFGAKAPTGLAGINCSSNGAKDGKILNVSDKMEYTVLTNGKPGTYTSISGSSITGLAAGTYYIRYKETSTADAGANAEITINVKASNVTTTPTVTAAPTTTATDTAVQTVTTAPTATTTTATSTSPNDQISAFVDRLYLSVLGREADEEGAKYWTNELVSFRMSGAQVAEKFVLSPEFLGSVENDTQFVTVLYKAFFNRDPDDDGLAYWTKALSDKTMTREEVERNFVYSQEWADTCAEYGILSGSTVKPSKSIDPTEATLAFVERMYTKAMNRESDPEGKAYWANRLANYECTGETIGLEFFTSAEMKSYNLDNEEFVKRLYSTFMDRDADSTGLSFWINELENGADRAEVVKGFAKSAEFEQRCIEARILPCEGLF